MSLKHAILVLLDREPGSGYDLTQRFSKGIGHFWQASHQQIYQQLKKLDEEKLVSFKTEEQSGKPDRKVYKISDNGRKTLADWIQQADKPPVVRDSLLIKVFAAKDSDKAAILAELTRHIQIHQQTLESHQQLEAEFFKAEKNRQQKSAFQYLTLRRGIRYEREWIQWLEETRSFISHGKIPDIPA